MAAAGDIGRLFARLVAFARDPGPKLERRRTDWSRALLYRFAYVRARLWKRRTLYVWPAVPPKSAATILKVAFQLGLKLSPGTLADRPLLIWHDVTKVSGNLPRHAMNAGCTDISKSRVATLFEEAFGYGYALDPTRHHGPMVVKSEENFTHDGHVVMGPLAARAPGVVYQRDIDGRINATEMIEYRLPVVLGTFPSVYEKTRLTAHRFATGSTGTRVFADVGAVFSAEEIRCLTRFCAAFALDFGELDIIRDRHDGRIYVLDVNKTPSGPPKPLAVLPAFRALQLISAAFARWPALAADRAGAHAAQPQETSSATPEAIER